MDGTAHELDPGVCLATHDAHHGGQVGRPLKSAAA
jgi:hypothetical protein